MTDRTFRSEAETLSQTRKLLKHSIRCDDRGLLMVLRTLELTSSLQYSCYCLFAHEIDAPCDFVKETLILANQHGF